MRICPVVKNRVSSVPSFVLAIFSHIHELKIRFLPIRETNVFRLWIFPSREPTFHEYLARVKIVSVFWQSIKTICVYWRELDGLFMETGLLVRKLDGLMTETGRSIDWSDYWWKMGVLMKETGRSIDGNWMVNWRKLVGLLMEKVRSIYESSPADFLRLGGLKMRFCRVPKPALSWTPSILQLIFFHFGG